LADQRDARLLVFAQHVARDGLVGVEAEDLRRALHLADRLRERLPLLEADQAPDLVGVRAEGLAHVDERPAPERLVARPLAREGTDRRGHGALEVLARRVGTAREGRARRRVDDVELAAARDERAVDPRRDGPLDGGRRYARL